MSLESEESLNVNFDDLLTEAFRDPDLGHLWFLGTLAYPTFSERKHVINFAKAVASLKTNALAEHFHKRIFLDKRLRGITAKKAQRNIGHVLYTRIPRRMQGVVIAMNVMNKWEPNTAQSVSHLIVIRERGQDTADVYKDIWTESKKVLHMALAIQPLIHKKFLNNEKPSVLSLSMLDDLKQKGIKKINQGRPLELPLKDLLLLSEEVRTRFNIEDPTDLVLSPAWLPDVLKIAAAWAVLLPKLIPTIRRASLIKI